MSAESAVKKEMPADAGADNGHGYGTAANGTAANGTAADGTAANGTAANGTAANGTAAGHAVGCAGQSAPDASCSCATAGSNCPLCRCLGWFAGMWRVLLAYLLGVGLLALLMTIMRRLQE